MGPQKYWSRIYCTATIAAIGLVFIGAGFAIFPKITQFQNYQKTNAALKEDIRIKKEKIKDLRRKQERFQRDKYFVQQLAHEIGYAHAGETIYQFTEADISNRTQEPIRE